MVCICFQGGEREKTQWLHICIYTSNYWITHLLNFAECTVIDGTISASNRKYCRCLMATTFSASHRSCIETFYGHDHTKYIHKMLVPSVVHVVVVVVYWIDISNGRKYNLYFITVFTIQIKAKLKCNMNIFGENIGEIQWMIAMDNIKRA